MFELTEEPMFPMLPMSGIAILLGTRGAFPSLPLVPHDAKPSWFCPWVEVSNHAMSRPASCPTPSSADMPARLEQPLQPELFRKALSEMDFARYWRFEEREFARHFHTVGK
jgi:hypothetical protein